MDRQKTVHLKISFAARGVKTGPHGLTDNFSASEFGGDFAGAEPEFSHYETSADRDEPSLGERTACVSPRARSDFLRTRRRRKGERQVNRTSRKSLLARGRRDARRVLRTLCDVSIWGQNVQNRQCFRACARVFASAHGRPYGMPGRNMGVRARKDCLRRSPGGTAGTKRPQPVPRARGARPTVAGKYDVRRGPWKVLTDDAAVTSILLRGSWK